MAPASPVVKNPTCPSRSTANQHESIEWAAGKSAAIGEALEVAWFPPVRTVGGGVCHPCSDSLHISRLTPHFPTVLRPGLKSAPSLVQELAPPQEVGHDRPPGPDRVVRVGHGRPLGVLVACPAVINLLLLD